MSDFIWFFAIGVLFVLLGLVFLRLGLAIWKKQRIGLVIRHHMDKVSGQNRQAYCRLCGIGVFISGIGFAVSGICMFFSAGLFSWIPLTAGLAAGIILMAAAVIKYNR